MCIIDHDNKIIFIAIPKTGTTSTQSFLRYILSKNSIIINSNHVNSIGLCKHSTAKDISSIIENYSDYHSIAVIRNPYDWYISWYTYRMRPNSGFPTNTMSFKEYLNKQPMEEILSYICDDNNNIIVDSIIRYEDGIECEIINILSKLIPINKKYKLMKLNVSKKRDKNNYKIYYNDETKEIVKNLQSNTLKKFGYQF